MNKIGRIGLSLVVVLVLVMPAYAQQNAENNDWQKIQTEKEDKKKVDLLVAFIKKNPKSTRRPEADFNLVDLYLKSNDNVKVLQHAEDFKTNFAGADNAAKSRIFTQAMTAAATIRDVKKTAEFGLAALEADSNSYLVLTFLAGNNLPNPVAAAEFAEKAVALPRPATMTEERYATMQVRMHGMVANSLFAQQKFKEANEHFVIALKADPKNHDNQFRHGFTLLNLAVLAASDAQKANAELIAAMAAGTRDPAREGAAKAKQEEASKQALVYRDSAVDALGKALALGGQYVDQAKPLFDNAYRNKTGSLDGQEQFIAQKKTELGL